MNPPLDFEKIVKNYKNTLSGNFEVIEKFKKAARDCPVINRHRQHVEKNKLGYGSLSLDALWASLFSYAAKKFEALRVLEIGVFKGQTIAFWSKIGLDLKIPLSIEGITPLKGNPAPKGGRILRKIRYYLNSSYRHQVDTGAFYPDEDYESIIHNFFNFYGTDFGKITLHKGYSTDPEIIEKLSDSEYEIIFVDGDHREATARKDFEVYGSKVVPGGWLIADDAGCDLPAPEGWWMGYPETTAALSSLGPLGFKNILNVWHNRVFERTKS